jgi:hypothetical protein
MVTSPAVRLAVIPVGLVVGIFFAGSNRIKIYFLILYTETWKNANVPPINFQFMDSGPPGDNWKLPNPPGFHPVEQPGTTS